MCSAEGALALNVMSSVMKYQGAKRDAKITQANNTVARREFDRGYLNDLTQIDDNKQDAKDEKLANILKNKVEKINAMAKQLNLNVGNAGVIMKDIGADYQFTEQDNERAYGIDMKTAFRQENEAWASYVSSINNLPMPYEPSKLGLAIDIAGAGVQYKRDQKTMSG